MMNRDWKEAITTRNVRDRRVRKRVYEVIEGVVWHALQEMRNPPTDIPEDLVRVLYNDGAGTLMSYKNRTCYGHSGHGECGAG